jgi:hypothetical protein
VIGGDGPANDSCGNVGKGTGMDFCFHLCLSKANLLHY